MALTPVEEARARVLADVRPTAVEMVPLASANGRVLAADLASRRTQPPFDASAMDGWAVRFADAGVAGARLKIVGEAAAGRAFAGELHAGEAVRIFTGAPVPQGADTIVLQEDAARDGDHVVIGAAARPDRHIRRAGIDFTAGVVGLTAGTRLDFTNLALVAAMNHAEVPVHRRPRVALLTTGDELVPPGTEPGPDQIVASNGYGVAALLSSAGAEVLDLGIVADDPAATAAAIERAFALGIDLLVTIGGASVGDHDLVHAALAAAGVAFDFWKLAMRPGKPLMFGRKGDTRVLGLPGNPAAALVCSLVYAAPLVRALAGAREVGPVEETVAAGVDLKANDLRRDYLRATLVAGPDGRPLAVPVDLQDSSLLSRFAAAHGLLVRPPHAPAATAGEPCRFVRFS